ncbi:ABC transporter ATP-binding protein [Alteribacter keqinensis]|uniref:ABC transporter ATP-binding protein n=1 Tax=Alteribacter keqinensis TaxID=2483800 RepID=A0A3M7TLQ7_9BACI|nr:ABC transporter ATP-binding protein [Alteribacter keqinensis]RNA66328.1 ABC transporter ATP-binding protein [Alteribacter keqinensis]
MKNDTADDNNLHNQKEKVTFRAFWEMVRQTNPPKWIVAVALLLSLIETGVGLVIPLFTQGVVDQLATGSLGTGLIIGFIVLFIVQAVSTGFSIYLLTYVGEYVVRSLRIRLWNKVLRLPVSYYDTNRTGETISRITNDTNIVKALITNHLVSAVTGVISIAGAVVILLFLDWQMTLVMLSVVPVILFIIIPLGRKMYRISKSIQKEMASFTTVLTQVLSEIRLVKAYNAEKKEALSGEDRVEGLFRFGLKEAKVFAVLNPLISLAMMAMLVFIIGYGGVRVASGEITAGELVAFILYLFMIVVPVSRFASFFAEVQKAMGATERISALYDMEEERYGLGERGEVNGSSLVFSNLTFQYEKGDIVLHDVSFEVPAQKVTAIVGPSGSGKSTLFSLTERFYEPASGVIASGGTPVRDIDLKTWRQSIGYVSQESPLMAGTIRENVSYGLEKEVIEDELVAAAKLANIDEYILSLPEGFDTEVGERGIKLSGGQRQRIAIARALLKNPSILMLDEATSSLDSESEQKIQEALDNVMKKRTTLVIAHRLSTVLGADQIIVLEKGRVSGRGTHDELYENNELYRSFVNQQFKIEG